MNTLYLLIGPSGCGKTTFRKKYLPTIPCVSPDDFIIGKWTPDKARYAWNYAKIVALELFKSNVTFVADAQFINSGTRSEWRQMATTYNYKVVVICFDTPWNQLLINRDKRGDRNGYGMVPIEAVKSAHMKFQDQLLNPECWKLFDKQIVIKWGKHKKFNFSDIQ